jgi:hypothetical protein
MSRAVEVLLARLYSSVLETERFLEDRAAYAHAVGLPEEHLQDVLAIDAATLRFTVQSFECKRGRTAPRPVARTGDPTRDA